MSTIRVENTSRNIIDLGIVDLSKIKGSKSKKIVRVMFGSSDDRAIVGTREFLLIRGTHSEEDAAALKGTAWSPVVEIPKNIWDDLKRIPAIDHFVKSRVLQEVA